MQKSLEYNRSLLRERTAFNKASNSIKKNNPVHTYPKATKAVRERIALQAIETRRRETKKLVMITIGVLITTLLFLLLFQSSL